MNNTTCSVIYERKSDENDVKLFHLLLYLILKQNVNKIFLPVEAAENEFVERIVRIIGSVLPLTLETSERLDRADFVVFAAMRERKYARIEEFRKKRVTVYDLDHEWHQNPLCCFE